MGRIQSVCGRDFYVRHWVSQRGRDPTSPRYEPSQALPSQAKLKLKHARPRPGAARMLGLWVGASLTSGPFAYFRLWYLLFRFLALLFSLVTFTRSLGTFQWTYVDGWTCGWMWEWVDGWVRCVGWLFFVDDLYWGCSNVDIMVESWFIIFLFYIILFDLKKKKNSEEEGLD